MKKIYAIICLIMLGVLSCCTTVFAAGITELKVDNVTASGNDETIDVPIKISKNLGICGMTLTINYDEKLTLKEINSGEALTSLQMTKPKDIRLHPLKLLWDGIEADKSNGCIVNLKFYNPGIAGTYEIAISYTEGDITEGDLNPIDVAITNGKITLNLNNDEIPSDYDCVVSGHIGGTASCSQKAVCLKCGEAYGEFDNGKHIGDVEVKDDKEATCTEAGFTGDTYCKNCHAKLKNGEEISATGHLFLVYVDDNNATDDNMGTSTAVCEYGCGAMDTVDNKADDSRYDLCEKNGHKGGIATCVSKAECVICGDEYGELNPSYHVGDLVCKDNKETSCSENGYSGDMCCTSCDTVVKEGYIIGATGHNFVNYIPVGDGETVSLNAICDNGCGAVDIIASDYNCELSGHKGGMATCIKLAVCAICETEYGEPNSLNHGEAEIRYAVSANCLEKGYTGNVFCKECNEVIKTGVEVNPIGHSFTNYISNDDATDEAEGTKTAVCDHGCGMTDTVIDVGSKKENPEKRAIQLAKMEKRISTKDTIGIYAGGGSNKPWIAIPDTYEGEDKEEYFVTVFKGSKTELDFKDDVKIENFGGVKVKCPNGKRPVVIAKGDGRIEASMSSGRIVTIHFRVESPKAQKAAKTIIQGGEEIVLNVKDLFGTNMDTGVLSLVKEKIPGQSRIDKDTNKLIVNPVLPDTIKVRYEIRDKKFNITIKITKPKK